MKATSALRSNTSPHDGSAFVGSDGEPVPALHCPWLGAKLPVADRLVALGAHALRDAIKMPTGLPPLTQKNTVLLLCLGALRPGLDETDRQRAAGELEHAAPASLERVFTGAASFFAALVEAD